MESWNIYPQNAPSTPSSTWLCPQNNTPGSEWLHSQNNSNERERNENTAALATPTRYIMEYNDVNQNSSSGSFYNPYAQEMERLFDNNFLKIGNPEDLLNNDIYNNENLSWLNSNENIIPVPTTTSNIINTTTAVTTTAPSNISTTNVTNSPTPSLVTDDDQDQYNLQRDEQQRIQDPVSASTTTASFIQYPITDTNTSPTKSSSSSSFTSPISPRVVKGITTTTAAATFYQPNLQDQYLQSKKHDPKQLLLPLSTNTNSIDSTMVASMTSPTSSLFTDDDLDQCDQTKTKGRRESYYQDFPLNISTNDLPMQQPSPASSEFSSGVKTPPPCNETTPKQKKRRVSQRKLNNRRASKGGGSLISPVDESYSESNVQTSASISDDISDTEESSPIMSKDSSIDSNLSSDSSTKREIPDDGHDETPEEKRARLLERNRIAAAKCRQKKKQAQECLQQQASDLTQKNTTMHSLVNDLREEALKLKNQLLAHSTCNCNVIQEYVRTSGQFAFARPPYTK